ncbi:Uncharacterized protein APZ42_025702 [Daphnia magna]|uniref:Uncharacterized protein n=1 Tax=Daphnia magna TaxID=35525 RepID=A0A164SRV1_9CRUS|nr:Uncharacterized protein APZ42_025702 [Daphnia magna]
MDTHPFFLSFPFFVVYKKEVASILSIFQWQLVREKFLEVYEFIPVFSKRWQSMIVCFFCFLSHCIIDRALTNNGQFCSFLSFSLATPYTFGFPRPPQLCSSFFLFSSSSGIALCRLLG